MSCIKSGKNQPPDMELGIISTEIIKPSSPTPPHLKTHKISLIDQSNLDIYFPLLLFYSAGVDKNSIQISDRIKKSLSETLTHYYPFAGRVKDDYSIACDDYGVSFVEAHVAVKMSEVLKRPEIEILEQLLPFNPNEKVSTEVNLAVQLNYFDCGGVAICVCFRHVITDATAAANFVRNWSTVACGNCSDIKDVIFDCTSIFPPHELTRSLFRSLMENKHSTKSIMKRFVFDGNKISALRENINNGSSSLEFYPTRFEAVSALIWGALIAVARENDESTLLLPSIPVNLRKRMNPPLPPQCIGNIIHSATANWLMNKAIDVNSLAKNIRECIKMVTDDYVRKFYEGDGYVNELKKVITDETLNSKVRFLGLSSWGGLPYYESDFGWGKPTWVSTAMRLNDVAILLDTCDGKGIEVWVGLPNNDMAKFQQDVGILTYAS